MNLVVFASTLVLAQIQITPPHDPLGNRLAQPTAGIVQRMRTGEPPVSPLGPIPGVSQVMPFAGNMLCSPSPPPTIPASLIFSAQRNYDWTFAYSIHAPISPSISFNQGLPINLVLPFEFNDLPRQEKAGGGAAAGNVREPRNQGRNDDRGRAVRADRRPAAGDRPVRLGRAVRGRESSVDQGRKDFSRGSYQSAIRHFESAVQDDQNDVDARLYLAQSHFAAGDYLAAVETIESAIRLDPNLPSANADILDMYHSQRSRDAHLSQLERHLDRWPGDAPAHFLFGFELHLAGQADQARKYFEKARSLGFDPAVVDLFLPAVARQQPADDSSSP